MSSFAKIGYSAVQKKKTSLFLNVTNVFALLSPLEKRRGHSFEKTPITQTCLWLSSQGSGEEHEHVKVYGQMDGRTTLKRSGKRTFKKYQLR